MTNMVENKAKTARFVEAFNTNDWDSVREVVAPTFVLHHPVGGDTRLGAEGMITVWNEFKASFTDSWHPIPIMIAEGDYVAVLLPTYGHFDGAPHRGTQPTGAWLEYGTICIVRFYEGQLAEGWIGMDPLVEMQQMGIVPPAPTRLLGAHDEELLLRFQNSVNPEARLFETIEVFGNVIVAMGPPQFSQETDRRDVDIYRFANGSFERIYAHSFFTDPPYAGTLHADSEATKAIMKRFIADVLTGHDLQALVNLVSEDVLVHPTGMPCEASFYGILGLGGWLSASWKTFPDLAITDHFTVTHRDIVAVRWEAKATSVGTFLGIPPTGEAIAFGGLSMYRLEHGHIAEIWDVRDSLGIIRQLDPVIAD